MASNYSRRSSSPFSGFNVASLMSMLPTLLSLGVIGLVLYVGVKFYKSIFPDNAVADAVGDANSVGASDYTSRSALTATSLQQLGNQLAEQGLVVSTVHQANANTLNAYMDSTWVDHDAIIGLINSMGTETFQLTAIAYGQRTLNNYHGAITHIFEPSSWTDLFTSTKLYGGLKFHLQTVLTSDEFSSIGAYVNSIP